MRNAGKTTVYEEAMDEYIRLSNVKVDPEQPDMAALDKFHFYLLHQEMVFLLGGVWSVMAVIKAILTGESLYFY